MCSFNVIFQFLLEDTQNGFLCSSQILEFTHSNLFQCIWNFQSFQYWLSSCSFLFVSSTSFGGVLLNILFFSAGRLWPNLFTYQPPPIAYNNDWRFSFGMSYLGSSTGVFWNNLFILKTYIWQRSMKKNYKAFRQQPMKYMVAPIKTNNYFAEFDGSGQLPPLLL